MRRRELAASSAAGSICREWPPRSRYSGRGAVDEDDVCAGGALERPAVVSPRRGQAVRRRTGWPDPRRPADAVGRAGCAVRAGRPTGLAHRPQPIHGAGQRELGGAEPFDEVAAPDPAGLLHRAKDRVDGAETAGDVLRRDGLAGQDAVPLQQDVAREWSASRGSADAGVPRAGAVAGRVGPPWLGRPLRDHERPSAGGFRRTQLQPARPRPALARRPPPAQRPQRRERVVGDLAGPDQIPQRVERSRARRRRRRPTRAHGRTRRRVPQPVAQPLVELARRRLRPSPAARSRSASRPGR